MGKSSHRGFNQAAAKIIPVNSGTKFIDAGVTNSNKSSEVQK